MPRTRKAPETDMLFDDDNFVEQTELEPPQPPPDAPEQSGAADDDLRTAILLLIFAVVIAGWYGVDHALGPHVIPHHGKKLPPPNEMRQFARYSTAVVFGLTGLMVLWQWVLMGWEAIRWHFIPKCVLIVLALADSGLAVKRHHDGMGWIIFGIATLIAASPLIERAINLLAFVLQNPLDTIRHLGGKR